MQNYIMCTGDVCRKVGLEFITTSDVSAAILSFLMILAILVVLFVAAFYLKDRKDKAVDLFTKKLKLTPEEARIIRGM